MEARLTYAKLVEAFNPKSAGSLPERPLKLRAINSELFLVRKLEG